MSTAGVQLPAKGAFRRYIILPNELTQYGLPDANRQNNMLSLVEAASVAIDAWCGRVDSEGNGSLVYSTYMERILMQARNRNIVRCSFKPLVAIPASVVNNLYASANTVPVNPATQQQIKTVTSNPLLFTNYFYTGCQPNTIAVTNVPGSTLSPFIGISGRYGATIRRSEYMIYPDLNYGANPIMIASMFGGPPAWVDVNIGMTDFDPQTGEIWVPAGIWASQYTEIVVIYNSGFDPLNMPRPIKTATAMLIRNYLSRGGGTTGLRSISSAGTANISFTPDLIDEYIQNVLLPFQNIIAY